MDKPFPLLDILACPVSGSDLSHMKIDGEAVLLSSVGIAYPVIDGIVVTRPSSSISIRQCEEFFARHADRLARIGGAYDETATREALFHRSGPTSTWHREEMDYWEAHFADLLAGGGKGTPGPNRTLPRSRLLRRLPGAVASGLTLELGCGSSETLSEFYGSGLTNYIGLDLSYNACLLARRSLPGGLFIQGAVEALPLAKAALDALVAYGVFHHLPDRERAVVPLLDYIRPGGLLIAVDPLGKPSVPRPFRRRTSGMSPHNEWIDWQKLQSLTAGSAEVACALYEYSPLRILLVKLLYDGLQLRSRSFTKLMMAADALWLATAGRLHRSLGPAAVHYALRVTGDAPPPSGRTTRSRHVHMSLPGQ